MTFGATCQRAAVRCFGTPQPRALHGLLCLALPALPLHHSLPAEGYYATKALQRQYGINVIETKLEEAVDAVKGEDFSCSALAYDSGAACLPLCLVGCPAPSS